MNLNEVDCSLETAIINFCNKPDQNINFRSQLNSVARCKKEVLSDLHMFLFDFISFYLFMITFAMKLKVFCEKWKILSDLSISHEKRSDILFLLLFKLTVVIKLTNFDFAWN